MNAKIYFGNADIAIIVVVATTTIKGFAKREEKSTNKADGVVSSDGNCGCDADAAAASKVLYIHTYMLILICLHVCVYVCVLH